MVTMMMTRKLQASTVRLSSVDAQALTSIFPNSRTPTSSVGSASLLGQGRAACHRTRPSQHRIRSNSRLDEVLGYNIFNIIRAVLYAQDIHKTHVSRKIRRYISSTVMVRSYYIYTRWSHSRYIFTRISVILYFIFKDHFSNNTYLHIFCISIWSKRP